MREDGSKEKLLLRRLYERSAEICVLRQRLEVLLQVPLSDTTRYNDADDHGTRPPDSSWSATDVPDPASDTAQGERFLSHSQKIGNRDTLMGCIARVRGSAEQQVSVSIPKDNRHVIATITTSGTGFDTKFSIKIVSSSEGVSTYSSLVYIAVYVRI